MRGPLLPRARRPPVPCRLPALHWQAPRISRPRSRNCLGFERRPRRRHLSLRLTRCRRVDWPLRDSLPHPARPHRDEPRSLPALRLDEHRARPSTLQRGISPCCIRLALALPESARAISSCLSPKSYRELLNLYFDSSSAPYWLRMLVDHARTLDGFGALGCA